MAKIRTVPTGRGRRIHPLPFSSRELKPSQRVHTMREKGNNRMSKRGSKRAY